MAPMNRTLRPILKPMALGACHYMVWVGMNALVDAYFTGSPARAAYAMLSAWRASLYAGYVVGIRWRAIVPLCGIVIVASILSVNPLTLGPSDLSDWSRWAFVLTGMQVLVLSSPIVVNGAVRQMLRLIVRARSRSQASVD